MVWKDKHGREEPLFHLDIALRRSQFRTVREGRPQAVETSNPRSVSDSGIERGHIRAAER